VALLALSKEEPAPQWIAYVAFAVPAAIMLLVLRWGLKRRRRWKRTLRAQRERGQPGDVALHSVDAVADPTQLSSEALLKAMAVRPEDHGPTADGMPHDEGWRGTMLGLKSKIASDTAVLMPHVYWGEHGGFQVLVREGADEKLEGATTFLTERHLRSITVVRVAAPPFTIRSVGGQLTADDDAPAEVAGALARIGAGEDVWGTAVVYGGPEGLVATRPSSEDFSGSTWVYDLWLLEHLARTLRLEPLPKARIGPSWKVPYELGRRLEPKRGS
jgi:hypothetical protein